MGKRMNRQSFHEALVSSLAISEGEREELLARAHAEGPAFARMLVARGLLSAEALRRAYETICGIPPFRKGAPEDRPLPPEVLPLSFLRARLRRHPSVGWMRRNRIVKCLAPALHRP